jgi:mRNA interferase HigB
LIIFSNFEKILSGLEFEKLKDKNELLILGRNILENFWNAHKDAENALKTWIQVVQEANWHNFVELKKTYPKADLVGDCTAFNVRGNNYRLIAIVNYAAQIVQVLFMLTHKEYDKDKWKKACNC